MASIRGRVRDRADRRDARLPLVWAVENVNHVVRGLGELTSAAEDVRIVVELRRRASGLTVRGWRWVVLDVARLGAADLLYDASCGRVR